MGAKKIGFILGFLEFLFLDGLLLSMAQRPRPHPRPTIHHYDFVLKEANLTKLRSTKSMLTVNGSFPGATIMARKGDTMFVNVINQGTFGVTIHW
ncbi:hypothetical protein Pint_07806 [Pistacia integerrima]|uniref:Uncharacterized protein n=1 Tax=Pistacia integerrima TaxID=434235 RepID=A0ACC0XXR2_9ROSI|nr:hypothetical protein Pint_07806 [Pistacia integerrima]